jgi:hypothetical protein
MPLMKVSAGGPFTGSQAQIILLLLVIYRKARNMVADPGSVGVRIHFVCGSLFTLGLRIRI